MHERGIAASALVLVLIPVSAVGAQTLAVGRGDRVRVTSEQTSGEFVVAAVRPGALSLSTSPDDAIDVPITSLTELQVQRGRQISTAEGLFGGAAVGALLGGVLGLQDLQTHYSSLTRVSMKQSIALGAGLGVLVGLVVSRRSAGAWQPVLLPHRLDERPRPQAPRDGAPTEPERVIVAVGDVASSELVELIVRNRSPEPINAFAWWEGGSRVSLGVVRASSTTSFITARRSPGIVLFVSPVSSPGRPTGLAPRPSEFIVIGPDEQIQWVVLSGGSGVVQDYVRLTPR